MSSTDQRHASTAHLRVVGTEPEQRPTAGPAVAPTGTAAPATAVTVRPWHDPTLARHGHDPRGEYVERFWLGVVGPSVLLLARRFARGFEEHPGGFGISLPDTARAIGLGAGTGRNSPMNRTIERACMFGLMRQPTPTSIEVRTHLPSLSARQLDRLPLAVRSAHEAWMNHHHERAHHDRSHRGPGPDRPDAA